MTEMFKKMQDDMQALVEKYYMGKTFEDFVEDLPAINCKLDPWKDLYFIFEYFTEQLGKEKIKVSYRDILVFLCRKYDKNAYIELFELRDGFYSPPYWSFLGMSPRFILLLDDLLSFFKDLKKFNTKFGVSRPLELFEMRYYVQYIQFRERDYLDLLNLDLKSRKIADVHSQIDKLHSYHKEISEKVNMTYPTVRKYLEKLYTAGFRVYCKFDAKHIGLEHFQLNSAPAAVIEGTKIRGFNIIVRKDLKTLQSFFTFSSVEDYARNVYQQARNTLQNTDIILYRRHVLRDPESTSIFEFERAKAHITKDGDLQLNKEYLMEYFEDLIEKYEPFTEKNTPFIKFNPATMQSKLSLIPAQEVTPSFLRAVWTHTMNPLMLVKHFREMSGLTKNYRAEFLKNFSPYFTYDPFFGNVGTLAGRHFAVVFTPPEDLLQEWHVNFMMDVFKTFPLKTFIFCDPMIGSTIPIIFCNAVIVRNDVQTFYQYLNHVESTFPIRFRFNINPIIYIDQQMKNTFDNLFDEATGKPLHVREKLRIHSLSDLLYL